MRVLRAFDRETPRRGGMWKQGRVAFLNVSSTKLRLLQARGYNLSRIGCFPSAVGWPRGSPAGPWSGAGPLGSVARTVPSFDPQSNGWLPRLRSSTAQPRLQRPRAPAKGRRCCHQAFPCHHLLNFLGTQLPPACSCTAASSWPRALAGSWASPSLHCFISGFPKARGQAWRGHAIRKYANTS